MKAGEFDVVILGAGFGGALMAMAARRLGRSVLLLERGRHPRFAIGESSTPLANLLLEDLAQRYDLKAVRPLAKWGTWQSQAPKVACGLKRGFTFFHHQWNQAWSDDDRHRHQLLVGASPRDDIADTHWYRPDFDQHLVEAARSMGVVYRDHTVVTGVCAEEDGMMLTTDCSGKAGQWHGRFVVDATGPRGCLFRQLRLEESGGLPATESLYSHFTGVKRWADCHVGVEAPPYPVDDAAMHHVFPGGWIWVLRFNNGRTSAGVAATAGLARELRLAEGAAAWERLLRRLPAVAAQFEEAVAVEPFRHRTPMPFRSSRVTGPAWALLPSAAGVVDPLLSTGFTLNLLGIARLCRILESDWDTQRMGQAVEGYGKATLKELDAVTLLVGALYRSMPDFDAFVALTKLYFAAVGYMETTRRLGHGGDNDGLFLLQDNPGFAEGFEACCREPCVERIHRFIEPFDVMGLNAPDARNWHSARAEDLLAAAGKLGVTEAEIRKMLVRSGFVKGENPG